MRNKSVGFPFRLFGDECRRRIFEIAYLLSLPVAAWYLYRFSVFNNRDGFLDPWVYFGYVHNFQDLIDRYGLPYYSVRFGLIFPLIALVKVFGPINGYLAFVYSMYLLAGVPLYLLFRKRFSIHAAMLAYSILVSSVWFARAVLWTHPDASAVPYLLAAVALMFLEPEHRRFGYFVVGLLFGLAANSNIFALAIGGLSGVAYSVYYKNTLWPKVRQDIPWMTAGFVVIFTGGAIGYYACCHGMNFLGSTLGMIEWSAKGFGSVYQSPFLVLVNLNYLYLLPFLMLSMVAVLRKISPGDRSIWFAALSYLGASITFYVGYELSTKTALLEHFHYVSFLLAPCMLSMTLVPVILARAGSLECRLLNLALASFVLPPLIIVYGSPTSLDNIPVYWVWLSLACTLLVLLLAIRFERVASYAIVGFALSIQMSLSSTVFPASEGLPIYARMYGTGDGTGLSRYLLGLKFIETMPQFRDDGRPIYFWYANADKVANSLQATYLWGYSRIMDWNKGTRGLPFLNGVNIELLRQRSFLVLFDRDREVIDQGIGELHRVGIRFAVNKTREICENETCYTIAVLDVSGELKKVGGSTRRLIGARHTSRILV
jgi:hypothetical protein